MKPNLAIRAFAAAALALPLACPARAQTPEPAHAKNWTAPPTKSTPRPSSDEIMARPPRTVEHHVSRRAAGHGQGLHDVRGILSRADRQSRRSRRRRRHRQRHHLGRSALAPPRCETQVRAADATARRATAKTSDCWSRPTAGTRRQDRARLTSSPARRCGTACSPVFRAMQRCSRARDTASGTGALSERGMVKRLVRRPGWRRAALIALVRLSACAHYGAVPLGDGAGVLSAPAPSVLSAEAVRIDRPYLRPAAVDLRCAARFERGFGDCGVGEPRFAGAARAGEGRARRRRSRRGCCPIRRSTWRMTSCWRGPIRSTISSCSWCRTSICCARGA